MGAVSGSDDVWGTGDDAYAWLFARPREETELLKGQSMANVCIGVDIGQKVDPTSICVVEPQERTVDGRQTTTYLVRHLERLALGTPYPRVAERVAEVVAGVRQKATAGRGITVFIDATGVGQPIVDLLKASGVRATPVYFTFGDRRIEQEDRSVTLGKAFLVSRLQVLLQCGRILLPKTSEADALARELLDYEIRVDEQANEKYGAFRTGVHDDLATALGLATQLEPRRPTITWG